MCFASRKWIALVTAEDRCLPPKKLPTSHCCSCKLSVLPLWFIACATACDKHHSVLRWILLGYFEWGSDGRRATLGTFPCLRNRSCQLHHLFWYHCLWNWFWHLVLHQIEGCFVFSISWSHWAVSYLNAPVLIGEPEPSRSWHYFVKSVCCKKPRARNWWLELGFQLETRIPVCDLTSLSKLSRLHTEGWVFRCTFLEGDRWEWIWLTAHRFLFKIPKGILN